MKDLERSSNPCFCRYFFGVLQRITVYRKKRQELQSVDDARMFLGNTERIMSNINIPGAPNNRFFGTSDPSLFKTHQKAFENQSKPLCKGFRRG